VPIRHRTQPSALNINLPCYTCTTFSVLIIVAGCNLLGAYFAVLQSHAWTLDWL
jgi:hypothetical protein